MKAHKYITAFISFFDNEIIMNQVMADSAIDAMCQTMIQQGYEMKAEDFSDEYSVKEHAFDLDCQVNAFRIS